MDRSDVQRSVQILGMQQQTSGTSHKLLPESSFPSGLAVSLLMLLEQSLGQVARSIGIPRTSRTMVTTMLASSRSKFNATMQLQLQEPTLESRTITTVL